MLYYTFRYKSYDTDIYRETSVYRVDAEVTQRRVGINREIRDAYLEKEKREEEEYIAKHTYIPQKRSICLNLDQ